MLSSSVRNASVLRAGFKHSKTRSVRSYAKLLKGQKLVLEKPTKPAVFMFPGQGCQFPGMGKELARDWPEARYVFEEVDEALRMQLSKMMFDGTESDLRPTEISQPAILAHCIAILAVLRKELGKDPIKSTCAILGHSLGEITGFVAADAMSLSTAATFVHERGMFMQSACPKNRATGLTSFFPLTVTQAETIQNEVSKLLPHAVLDIACINSPKIVVLSGDANALKLAAELVNNPATGIKSKAIPLDVSAPFHSRYMAVSASVLTKRLDAIKMKIASAPIISGYNHRLQIQCPNHLIDNFVPLTSGTVNFMGAIEQANNVLHTQPESVPKSVWVEIGPKPILTSFVQQTVSSVEPIAISTSNDIRNLLKNKDAVTLLTSVNKRKL